MKSRRLRYPSIRTPSQNFGVDPLDVAARLRRGSGAAVFFPPRKEDWRAIRSPEGEGWWTLLESITLRM
jgi:hypothetical protein